PNMGQMGGMAAPGSMGNMPNMGQMGGMAAPGSMGNMPNMGQMGGMANASNMPMGQMAMENTAPVLYEADPKHTAMVMEIRDRVMGKCGGHMHKYVCVQMVDGHVYEGTIMHIDHCVLYLQCTMRDSRAFMNPYSAVLPLILYELLVITLL
ncbi:hypothetical protein, partial [Paenibacillus sp. PL91]|uniref:hypothetical protein n=1 Tax=Paenibacillus sp. PL91 TaxID=2729538 RepID=UPI001659FB02